MAIFVRAIWPIREIIGLFVMYSKFSMIQFDWINVLTIDPYQFAKNSVGPYQNQCLHYVAGSLNHLIID